MNNQKLSFIANEKADNKLFIAIDFSNKIPSFKIHESISVISKNDGNFLCQDCNFVIKVSDHNLNWNNSQNKGIYEAYNGCPTCKKKLKWDLEEQYKKYNEIATSVDLFKYIFSENFLDTLLDNPFNSIDTAILLLTEEQKYKLYPYLFSLICKIKTTYNSEITRIKSEINELKNFYTALDAKFNAEIFENDHTSKVVEDLQQKISNLSVGVSTEILAKVYTEVEQRIRETIQNEIQMLAQKFDREFLKTRDGEFYKIKRTLNIMMELWEKGTDWETILLKAKTNAKDQMYNTNFSITSNYNLNSGNNWVDCSSIDSAKRSLFERFST